MERSMYGYLFTLLDDDKVEHAKHYTTRSGRSTSRVADSVISCLVETMTCMGRYPMQGPCRAMATTGGPIRGDDDGRKPPGSPG